MVGVAFGSETTLGLETVFTVLILSASDLANFTVFAKSVVFILASFKIGKSSLI